MLHKKLFSQNLKIAQSSRQPGKAPAGTFNYHNGERSDLTWMLSQEIPSNPNV